MSLPGQLNMFPEKDGIMVPKRAPCVYVTQETHLNLAKAAFFGQLIPLLPAKLNITMGSGQVIHRLRKNLINIHRDDYLLPIGDPIAIALSLNIAADYNDGFVKVLKWDKEVNDYYVVNVNFYEASQ